MEIEPSAVARGDPGYVLERIVGWAGENSLVRAVIIEGSRADRDATPDRFSDYDLAIVVTDPTPFVESHEWESWFGEPLIHWGDRQIDQDIERTMRLVIYGDGTRIDYCIWTPGALMRMKELGRLPAILDTGYRVLLDKDGITADLPIPTYTAHIPSMPDEAEFIRYLDDFWIDAAYVAKSLARRELLPSKYGLSLVTLGHLRRLLEWQVEIEHAWSLRVGRHGRRLREFVRPDWWHRLEATLVGAEAAENWAALWNAVGLHHELAVEVAGALGFLYPHERDARVMVYLRSLSPEAGTG
jgi:aminoglycoside 6-adenylyltransferase